MPNEIDDELYPHRDIAEFLAEGLALNDSLAIIATLETRQSIEAHLVSAGIRLVDLESQGRACWFDSHRVLDRILVNGLPEKAEFEKVTREIVSMGPWLPGRRIRTYYDLVDVLHQQGNLDAAVLLLRLWNDFCKTHDELLLAYTVASLYREKDCAI